MQIIQDDSCWYSWIPTNIGNLNFNYIAVNKNINQSKYESLLLESEKVEIKKLSSSFISDSFIIDCPKWIKKFILPNNQSEIFSYTNIEIRNNNDTNIFTGSIELVYPDVSLTFLSNFEIEKNGKIKFFNFNSKETPDIEKSIGNFDNTEHFKDYIVQIFFVIIKGIVHGDHHHHQKIDVSINVIRNEFNPFKIVEDLIRQVKSIEYDIKNFKSCGDELKIKNSIEEMKGYKSYIYTFSELFIKVLDKRKHEKFKNLLDNVLLSLESSVKKYTNKQENRDKIITFMFSYLGVFISLTVLFFKQNSNINSGLYFIAIIILFMLLGIHLNCKIKSYLFYNKYYWIEIFYHLKYAENSDLKPLAQILKFFYNYRKGFYYFILGLLGSIIYYNYFYTTLKLKTTLEYDQNIINNNINKELELLINLNKKNIEINNELNFNISQIKNDIYNSNLELIFSLETFFDNGSIFIKDEYVRKIKELLNKIDKNSFYTIKIDSYSSSEKLISNNTFSDNYQLSEARAENLKNIILEELIKNGFFTRKINFLITYNSNSNFSKYDKNYDLQRSNKLKIYRETKINN